ncbi:PTS 2-O-a-mannosyl-D-glycerate transporter subunit IIABC [Paenilisteria rocourtiae]|uniref:PTS system mannosylglycerate-specific IIA component (Fru family) /PTS system mannosylglycerate-specific IIB component (Fru family) /PTS system mannosylglycerate-specific IIC component (Fru family) n=1 Tax=Listeria rocourtiae TaxID=647910 RepID=A0A4R6ZGE8_9LIST|nr:PTS 2-O-a-mannosyl-D-glycerate transporter subunit IIABC [Listeria rocourtiae]EUJ44800.1 PTS system 2-O-a-mannosyl-D-glycerate specific transporter subunit IIABC [Listeria rocourtiae FSL F6-920]TDR51195.1 PTS system mannosylglycerate-specific IIA component (Fru family) /PTS system mannosylglycerate-specific IIB component (Fru family) /PTS system mannosylglycerate-specific IIC component (Fru family) [Listeria rocourtiae]
MKLTEFVKKGLVAVNQSFATRDEAIQFLADKLDAQGVLSDRERFVADVYERESQSVTGMENGLAIPHAKSTSVKQATFAAVTLREPIDDWPSLDPNNKVNLIFLLAIPDTTADTHLAILAELATRLVDEDYRARLLTSKTEDAFYENLDAYVATSSGASIDESKQLILAVTACPAGIAHTYMAAENLQKSGAKMGVNVRVEKQGANGIEDRFTNEELEDAHAVIFAADVAVKDMNRFSHLPSLKTSVAKPLHDSDTLIEQALRLKKDPSADFAVRENVDQKSGGLSDVKDAVMTGISHIIPLIVAGGMILAFAVFISQIFHVQDLYNTEGSWLWMFRQLGGGLLGTIMIPVLSAYIAYSLADKPALGPGFAIGVAANLVNGGFLGALIGGLLIGYFMRFMKKYIKPKGVLSGFVSFWVYPVVGSLVAGVLMIVILGGPISALNETMISWLNSLSGGSALLLGAVLGIMVSFDLGGPVNKAAYAFCIAAIAEGNFMPYAIFSSVKMVSAFAVTMATLLFKKYYDDYEIGIGRSTWILGLAGITEGAIPFMIRNPLKVIPSLCVGSAVTGAIVAVSNIGLSVPGAGIFSLFLLNSDMNGFVAAAIWFFAAVIGAIISATLLIAFKRAEYNKKHVQTILKGEMNEV